MPQKCALSPQFTKIFSRIYKQIHSFCVSCCILHHRAKMMVLLFEWGCKISPAGAIARCWGLITSENMLLRFTIFLVKNKKAFVENPTDEFKAKVFTNVFFFSSVNWQSCKSKLVWLNKTTTVTTTKVKHYSKQWGQKLSQMKNQFLLFLTIATL